MTNNPTRLPWRPYEYMPEYCDRVIEWGKLGKSKAWMCAELDCSPQTMANWCEKFPDFLEAITRAVAHSQKWWEDKGQESLDKTGFQGNMWSRSMAARFPNDWREKTAQEISGPKGGAINVNISSDDDRL